MKTEYKISGSHVELYFDKIPETIRESLKVCGWRWIGSKKCWSNFSSQENVDLAKTMCEAAEPRQEIDHSNWKKQSITMQDLVVRSNGFYCNKHHELEDMVGEVDIRDRVGRIYTCLMPIVFCRSCSVYYVLEETYLDIKKKGIIMCQILSFKEYQKSGVKCNAYDWQAMSPLRKWGYTVSQIENYSDVQRQGILEDIVDYSGLSKDEVLSYLDFFIRINSQRNEKAMEKWKSDREYIAKYQLGTAKRVRIRSVSNCS